MSQERIATSEDARVPDREDDHERRNQLQADLFRQTLARLRSLRSRRPSDPAHAQDDDQRRQERRKGRGGRRRLDRGVPWWQKGLAFAIVCAILRCWRLLRR